MRDDQWLDVSPHRQLTMEEHAKVVAAERAEARFLENKGKALAYAAVAGSCSVWD